MRYEICNEYHNLYRFHLPQVKNIFACMEIVTSYRLLTTVTSYLLDSVVNCCEALWVALA